MVDKKGIKWFGTEESGIYRYDGENWTIIDLTITVNAPQKAERLFIDAHNNLWVAGNGLFKYDGTKWTVYNSSNSELPDNSVSCVYANGQDFWVCTKKGLSKYNGQIWTHYTKFNSKISPGTALAIDVDSKGNIWLAYSNGIEKFDGKNFSFFESKGSDFTSMVIDQNDVVWAGCLTGAISFYGGVWTMYEKSNSNIYDNVITMVYTDHSNNLWLGLYNGMVEVKRNSIWKNYDPSSIFLQNSVKEIVFDWNGLPFLGVRNSPILKYNWESTTLLKPSGLSLTTDDQYNLYVKNIYPVGHEIERFDGTNWTNIPFEFSLYGPDPSEFEEISIDHTGGIWIDYLSHVTSTGSPSFRPIPHEGIAYYDGTKWIQYHYLNTPLSGNSINGIKVDQLNNIWVGTSSELAKYDGKNWTVFNDTNSDIPHSKIHSLAVDTKNNVWTSNGHFGFVKFDGSNWTKFHHPTLYLYDAWEEELEFDIDGKIWQIVGGYLIGFDGTYWNTFNHTNSPLPRTLISLSIDKFGNKWICTNEGILVYKEGGIVKPTSPDIPKEVSVVVYPNPFDEYLELMLDEPMPNVELTLFDMTSRLIFSKKYEKVENIIVPQNWLSSGIYFYRLKSNNELLSTGKILKK